MGMRWEVGDTEYGYSGIIAAAGRAIGKNPDHGVVVVDVLELNDFAYALRNKINDFTVPMDNVNHACFQLAKACNCLTSVLYMIHAPAPEAIVFA